jgi:hypothetical protein
VKKMLETLHESAEDRKRLKGIDAAAKAWAEWRLGQCDAPKGIDPQERVLLIATLGAEDPRLSWMRDEG